MTAPTRSEPAADWPAWRARRRGRCAERLEALPPGRIASGSTRPTRALGRPALLSGGARRSTLWAVSAERIRSASNSARSVRAWESRGSAADAAGYRHRHSLCWRSRDPESRRCSAPNAWRTMARRGEYQPLRGVRRVGRTPASPRSQLTMSGAGQAARVHLHALAPARSCGTSHFHSAVRASATRSGRRSSASLRANVGEHN